MAVCRHCDDCLLAAGCHPAACIGVHDEYRSRQADRSRDRTAGHPGNTPTRRGSFTAGPDTAGTKTPSWEGFRSMVALWRRWLQRWQAPSYVRRSPLVLINGLAEQAESWFFNVPAWRRDFDVFVPNLLNYEGPALHRRIGDGQPIDIDYLV